MRTRRPACSSFGSHSALESCIAASPFPSTSGMSRLSCPTPHLFRGFVASFRQRARFCKLLFDPCDLTAQPASKSFFQLELRAAAIEIVNGLPLFIEGNKPARRTLTLQFTGNKLYQSTLAARMCPRGIAQIRTTGGVF